jgi:hypothetical protein
MKRHAFILISLSSTPVLSTTNKVIPAIITRSQSSTTPRNLVGTVEIVTAFEPGELKNTRFDGFVSVTPEYQQSFRSNRISQCLFGSDLISRDDCPRLLINGSQVKNRAHQSWLADYFGLPPDYESIVEFSPVIQDYIVDFSFFLRWNNLISLFVSFPFVYTKRSLDIHETVITPGIAPYAAGYFAPQAISRNQLSPNFTSFISGFNAPPNIQPLRYGKMTPNPLTKTGLADVQILIGADIVTTERISVYINTRCAIPTGTTPSGEFLFEPIIGNHEHWELGGGATLGIMVWKDSYPESYCAFFTDLQLTHLFASPRCKFFDLCLGGNSRYMLAHKLGAPIQDMLQGDQQDALLQFKEIITPIANLTTLEVNTKHSFQAELTAFFHYHHYNWEFNIGYNLWAISCEQICVPPHCNHHIDQGWALKGDAHLFGFDAQNNFTSVALSATQSSATIHSGNNYPGSVPFITIPDVSAITFSDQNPGVDNPQTAQATTTAAPVHDLVVAPNSSRTIATSIQPVLLSSNDIDLCSALTRGMSHSIFTHISYRWTKWEDTIVFLGIGGKVEVVPTVRLPKCSTCPNCTVTQAAVWVKGGVSFD